MEILGYGEESLSVGFEEIPSDKWKEKVYRPDIEARSATLYKKPDYRMQARIAGTACSTRAVSAPPVPNRR
ncbi:hypothetical protein [Burkholderia sp. ABCPW 11]|uniref:hypothetical protein n=1 Tax=Burkholderia sp. ABCPW 11 TaxID=1637859 RepID=UPI000B12D829|nr:hypothetical protein [Burkholderia sp. ABCPW 11]